MDKTTLISVDCDPECRWRLAVDELIMQRDDREKHIMTTEVDVKQSTEFCTRLTDTGYSELRAIEKDYLGIGILSSMAATCIKACPIERFLDCHDTTGAELTNLNDNLKGTNNG